MHLFANCCHRLFVLFVVTAALGATGIVACAKIDRPRVNDRPASQPAATTEEQQALDSNYCNDLGWLPQGRLSYYPILRSLMQLDKDPSDIRRVTTAHRLAMGQVRGLAIEQVNKTNPDVARRLVRNLSRLRTRDGSWDADLRANLRAFGLFEESACGSAFLALFYQYFIQNLDPFAIAVFAPADLDLDGPAISVMPMAEGDWAVPSARVSELDPSVLVITLRRFEESEALTGMLAGLPALRPTLAPKAAVLDLRSAAGDDVVVLEKIRTALLAATDNLPVVVWTDDLTRGTAEVFAAELAHKLSTIVVGNRSFGYSRSFCRKSAPIDSSTRLLVSFGCQVLRSPEGPISPLVFLTPGPETLEERARLRESGIPLPSRPLETHRPPQWLSPDTQSLISSGSPGSLEQIVRIARDWSQKAGLQ